MFKLHNCSIKEISTNVMTKTYVSRLLVGSDKARNKSMIGDHDFEVTRLHENCQLIHLSLIDPNKVIKITDLPLIYIIHHVHAEL